MRILWGKRTIVVRGLKSFYPVRLSFSACDFYGHYGKGRENRGSAIGQEVAFVTFTTFHWLSLSFMAPR